MKRLLLLILTLTLLTGPACAEDMDQRLGSLDIISQMDSRFSGDPFIYNGTPFQAQGCLPSSVCNALTALLAAPGDCAEPLLEELLLTLCGAEAPHHSRLRIKRLPMLLSEPEPETVIASLTEGVDHILPADNLLHVPTTMRQLEKLSDGGILLSQYLVANTGWEDLCKLLMALDEAGMGDARLALCGVGAGYYDYSSNPFGSGENGHYIALFLTAGEFCRRGTFYLLDSYPRALADEPYGNGQLYMTRYSFVHQVNSPFCYNYVPRRISPTVLGFTLTQREQDVLAATRIDTSVTESGRQEKLIKLYTRYIHSATIYGKNMVLLYIP